MTDLRALCAELYAAFNTYAVDESHYDLMRRARAALAEPQPTADGEVAATGKPGLQVEPTDEELWDLWDTGFEGDFQDLRRFTRAVLARWGNYPATPDRSLDPIPVRERLRQMEDLAADAMAGLRYIEHWHGRLSGVGWDRLHGKAMRLDPLTHLPLPKEVE
jgi:diadenosine tetraphosphatase ApaH/serine/threonine PP2A family protein phosphatase